MTMSEEDPFDDIVAGVDISINESEVLDVSKLSTLDLSDILTDLEQKLLASEQSLWPRTQQTRDMTSLRNAVQLELKRRGKL
jgi:hypothetical protein